MKNSKLLKIKNIHKHFGGNHVLKGVSLSVDSGEVLGLIGNNGAGKSTLVKMISGVLSPDKGKIYWKGEEVNIPNVKKARELGIETVHQEHAVIEERTVAENIFIGREICKGYGHIKILDKRKMSEEAKSITKRLGLGINSPAQKTRFCSGGEKKGVAIARAMYFKANFVILDEPTIALSVEASRRVLDFVGRLKNDGIGCMFVTHNIHHVYPVANKFIVLSQGTVRARIKKEETTVEDLEESLTNI